MLVRKKLLPFLNQPVLFINKRKDKWQFVIFVNLFTTLFLIIFQPFGVNNYDPTHQLSEYFVLGMFGFGLFNGMVMAGYEFFLVPLLFPTPNLIKFCGRIILLLLLLSCSTFWFYNFIGDFHDWHFLSFLGFIKDISFMLMLPIAAMLLYFNYKNEKAKNKSLLAKPLRKELFWLIAENKKDKLGVKLEELLFIEAQDNYVAIYQQINGHVKKRLLRSSLKNIEEQLINTRVQRCHRSFLVNLKQVKFANGNAHQYQLYINAWERPILVSRNYILKITSQLDIPTK